MGLADAAIAVDKEHARGAIEIVAEPGGRVEGKPIRITDLEVIQLGFGVPAIAFLRASPSARGGAIGRRRRGCFDHGGCGGYCGVAGTVSNPHLDFDVVAQFGSGGDLDGLAKVSLDPIRDKPAVGLNSELAVLDDEGGGSIEPHIPSSGPNLTSHFAADSFGWITLGKIFFTACA
jgi:hypothetical protein